MIALIERFTGTSWKDQGPAFLVGAGHGATHWIIATFYVLLPYLSKELNLSYTEAGSLITLFHGSSFLANAGSGAVVDISGRRIAVLAASLGIGAVALIAVGFSANIVWLIAPVAVIGATNNLWHPAAISFLSLKYPKSRGFALSIHTLGASFGDILAPLAAGSLLLIFSWQKTALISALPIFAVAVILLAMLEENREAPTEHRSGGGAGGYISGVVALIRNRSLMSLCLMAGFRSMTQNGLLLFLPLYLVGVLAASPLMLGFAIMAMQVGGIFAGPLAGAWSDRIGRQPIVLAGLIGTSLIVFSLTLVDSMGPFIALVSILGFVLFSIRPVIHSWVLDIAHDDLSGTAISVLFGMQSALTLIVPMIGGMIADLWGLKMVFYLLTATIVLATIITTGLAKEKSDHL